MAIKLKVMLQKAGDPRFPSPSHTNHKPTKLNRSSLTDQAQPITMSPSVPTLYHIPYFSSSMPYFMALELGVPASELCIKTIDEEYLRNGDEILKVSPRRVVPVVEFPDGSTMVEAGAIVLYLLEQYDKQGTLHPLAGTASRKKFLQGVVYVVAECYKAAMEVFMLCHGKEKQDRDEDKLKVACEKFRKVVNEHLEREMGQGNMYYLGDSFSAADVMFAYPLMCVEYCDCGLVDGKVVGAYLERMKKREAYIKLFQPIS